MATGITQAGNGGDNTLTGGNDDDILAGLAGDDTLEGLGGDDLLDGGAGADWMLGGTGDDLYYVDDLADQVTEAPGAGWDIVRASVFYQLPEYVDQVILIGNTGGADGNELDNVILGTAFGARS